MRTKLLIYFCIKNFIGNRVKFVDSKNILTAPVVYATGCSKAMVPVLFLFYVTLWLILRGASCFKVLPCSLFSCFFIPFSIVITTLGREGAGLCASCAFVCLFCTR